MRIAFINTLTELASQDKNVFLVTGDLGFAMFEEFRDLFPNQYINVGVAEQDMIGIAAGLAMTGKRPFVYSISTFATMRPYEQVRNDLCYQNLPVVIVGGGSSFSYSAYGSTHMPFEDLAIMRVLPNMTVLSPGDPVEVKVLLNEAISSTGPVYMRIAKRGEPVVHTDTSSITIGKGVQLTNGDDATIFVTGRQLPNAVEAQNLLREEGIQVRVISMHTIKPFDKESVIRAAQETKGIVTCEEHFLVGGLSSLVAETLIEARLAVRHIGLGVPDEFPKLVGSQEYLLDKYKLSTSGIVEAVRKVCV